MQNVRHQRITLLEQRGHQFRGIGRFAEWLAANRSRFRGNVYGPVVAEVNVADKSHALILEQAVARTPASLHALWGTCDQTLGMMGRRSVEASVAGSYPSGLRPHLGGCGTCAGPPACAVGSCGQMLGMMGFVVLRPVWQPVVDDSKQAW